MTEAALLSVRGLEVRYATDRGPAQVLGGISLEIPQGSVVGVVGESGSGKSTLALALMGLLPANASQPRGSLIFDGDELAALSPSRRRRLRGTKMAMVFQDPMSALHPLFAIGTQMVDVQRAKNPGVARGELWRRAAAMLTRVGVPDAAQRMSRYPHEFSGGMRQRVMIAMALLVEPKLLIADEPTTALDATIEAQIVELLRDIRREIHGSVILISHSLGLVAELCDLVVVMYAGKVVETGPVADVFAQPRHPYTRALLGCEIDPWQVVDASIPLPRIPGSPPDLVDPPLGCVFAARCPQRFERCSEPPPLTPLGWPGGGWPGGGLLAGMSASSPLLAVESAVVRYGKLTAVDGLSLSVGEGETLGLVGESGCGKTSLAKALVRLLPLASGRILLGGIDTRGAAASAKSWLPQRIQLLFQDPVASLSPRLTIRRLLEEPLRIRRALTPESWREVEGTFTELGLARDILDRYPHQLSGGQARRVSMVRALAMRPRIIVADEPTAGLDLSVQGEMLNLLAQVQRDLGLTYLVVSHNLNIVGRITDRVAVMYLGQIVELGATRRVFDRPAHHYTAALLAANPVLDPQPRRQRIVLKSELPSPLNPPSGCRFHPRCAAAQERCRLEAPVLREVAEGQRVACHFPRDLAALGALGRPRATSPSSSFPRKRADPGPHAWQLAARPGFPLSRG